MRNAEIDHRKQCFHDAESRKLQRSSYSVFLLLKRLLLVCGDHHIIACVFRKSPNGTELHECRHCGVCVVFCCWQIGAVARCHVSRKRSFLQGKFQIAEFLLIQLTFGCQVIGMTMKNGHFSAKHPLSTQTHHDTHLRQPLAYGADLIRQWKLHNHDNRNLIVRLGGNR